MEWYWILLIVLGGLIVIGLSFMSYGYYGICKVAADEVESYQERNIK